MKNYIILSSISLIVGVLCGRYLTEGKVKTEFVEVVKVKENIKIVKETRPDGTIIETKEATKESDNSKVAKTEKTSSSPRWILSVKKDLFNDSQWGGEVGRAIFNNVYITTNYRTSGVVGIGLTISF